MGVANSLEVGSYDLTNSDNSHSNFITSPTFIVTGQWYAPFPYSHGSKERVKQTLLSISREKVDGG